MFTTVKLDNKVGGQTVQVDGYAGVRIGINVANKDKVKDRYCKPVIATESPYLWMNAAEVTFLRAEGALRGWSMGGDAKTLYEQAIALSFDQYGLTGADTYATNATDKPQAYKDPMKTYSVAAPASNITIAWQDGDDKSKPTSNVLSPEMDCHVPTHCRSMERIPPHGLPQAIARGSEQQQRRH